jgi:hypothetical protein
MNARRWPYAAAVLTVAAALLAGGAPAFAQAPAPRAFVTQSAT